MPVDCLASLNAETRREQLAVVTVAQHFRYFLMGRHFTVHTDHGSRTWLKNSRNQRDKWPNCLERLQEFDFAVMYRLGRKHSNADALSCLPCRQCGRDSHRNEVSVRTTFVT